MADNMPSPGQNLSQYYPAMLLARSLIELLRAWDGNRFPELPRTLLQEKAIPVLFQCLAGTLQAQRINGSWGSKGPREETAYAILTLASLLVLPLAQLFRPEIVAAIDRGRSFLKKQKTRGPEYLWIEKVTYGSANLSEAYSIAALYVSTNESLLGPKVLQLCSIPHKD